MNPHARLEPASCSRSLWRSVLMVLVFSLAIACALLGPPADAQQEANSKRRIVNRTTAQYPALARHMALSGVVKVDALVTPDGTVKTLDVKGGHPVLAQAAANTIRQWKWEP